MSDAPGEKLGDALFEGVREMLQPIYKRLAALEAQTEQLRSVGYAGVFQRALAHEYKRGVLVTFDGGLWCALRDVPAGAPGTSADWQLAVKAAR